MEGTKVQSINDEKSFTQENDFSSQPIKEEIDFSIKDNILQITEAWQCSFTIPILFIFMEIPQEALD